MAATWWPYAEESTPPWQLEVMLALMLALRLLPLPPVSDRVGAISSARPDSPSLVSGPQNLGSPGGRSPPPPPPPPLLLSRPIELMGGKAADVGCCCCVVVASSCCSALEVLGLL